ncbi:ABC transporter substrate-binding protein [Melghirimyces algeriensis]|uniref:NitT/TauT family transport system substrate-binding protein n=1 Tax=Melghirimyces algeriensis TaxID=910412 RepID=A0A521AR29_9BACL|nr:ABC transporter substrate-binding protein [Melghirimyces algeriensis]SMO37100.1 NitT/TauT family transport system substrate-binding protein [Melghirimyces algeriensis]
MRSASIRIRFLLMVSITLLVTACGFDNTSDKNTDTVRLVEVTHSIFYAPQYVAINKGFFKDEGIDLQLSSAFGGDKAMTALLSGHADIALSGAETAVYVSAQGAQHPVIGFAQLTQKDGSFLVSRKPVKQFDWNDLKGKELLGQRKGGMPEMVSEYVQRKNGLKPHKDLKIIQNVDFKNLGGAFASGTGDYVQLFEPIASKMEQEGTGHVVASFGKDSGNLPYTVYMSKKNYIEKHPDLVKRFTRAIHRGQRWVQSHSAEEIADVIQPDFKGTSRDILIKVIHRYKSQNTWASDPLIDRKEYQRMLQIMEQAGELPSSVPYETVIQTNIAEKVIQKEP